MPILLENIWRCAYRGTTKVKSGYNRDGRMHYASGLIRGMSLNIQVGAADLAGENKIVELAINQRDFGLFVLNVPPTKFCC